MKVALLLRCDVRVGLAAKRQCEIMLCMYSLGKKLKSSVVYSDKDDVRVIVKEEQAKTEEVYINSTAIVRSNRETAVTAVIRTLCLVSLFFENASSTGQICCAIPP
jgi:hypothetical protein